MKFFTNKHVIAAFIITPILAVLGYMLADSFVGEKPKAAQAGNSYPLLAQSNCRFSSGECDLRNTDFLARLEVNNDQAQPRLLVESEHLLEQVVVGLEYADQQRLEPQAMTWLESNQRWAIQLPQPTDDSTQLRIVLTSNGVKYFAETGMAFSQYATSFDKKF